MVMSIRIMVSNNISKPRQTRSEILNSKGGDVHVGGFSGISVAARLGSAFTTLSHSSLLASLYPFAFSFSGQHVLQVLCATVDVLGVVRILERSKIV